MFLIVKIAAGVFLGLLLYQCMVDFAREHDLSLAGAARSVLPPLWLVVFIAFAGIVATVGYLGYLALIHLNRTEYLYASLGMAASLYGLFFVYAVVSDRKARFRAQSIADKANCQTCGGTGLQFRRFEGGRKAPAGKEYDHPIGACSKCGHE